MATRRRRTARTTELRKAPTQSRAKATSEAILEATAHILIASGYDKLTTNHVAVRAGVSIGSVYQYFPSKDALVAALVDRHLERMFALVAGELSRAVDLPFAEGVERILRAIVHAQMVDPELNRAILEQVPRVGRMKRIRAIDGELEALLRTGLDARANELAVKDTRFCAFLMVQTAKWVTFAALLEHPEYVRGDKLVKELARMFVRYATREGSSARG